jgi:hypothetical protein
VLSSHARKRMRRCHDWGGVVSQAWGLEGGTRDREIERVIEGT